MGQAKQRGTYEERVAAAVKKADVLAKHTKPISVNGSKRVKSALLMAALLASSAGSRRR